MKEPQTEILVTVSRLFGRYHALASDGRFLSQKHALARTSGPDAAKRAAAKYFNKPERDITLQKSAPGVFTATVIETEGGS